MWGWSFRSISSTTPGAESTEEKGEGRAQRMGRGAQGCYAAPPTRAPFLAKAPPASFQRQRVLALRRIGPLAGMLGPKRETPRAEAEADLVLRARHSRAVGNDDTWE